MLTPEQVREIKDRSSRMIRVHEMGATYSTDAIESARAIKALLADRAEIRQELKRIQAASAVSSCGYCHATDRALTALIERMGK